MSASLVGSEMCIRDSRRYAAIYGCGSCPAKHKNGGGARAAVAAEVATGCLLYTSDAADDM
eukprot:530012-Alexandrium_andersonii.AAC.1